MVLRGGVVGKKTYNGTLGLSDASRHSAASLTRLGVGIPGDQRTRVLFRPEFGTGVKQELGWVGVFWGEAKWADGGWVGE
jgi:hypothetical protein